MAPIKVGIIGYGTSTKVFHLPFILPNPDLEVVAYLQRAEAPKDGSKVEKGTHCTVDYPNAKHHRTAEDFFADDAIELAIVCTHAATHAEFAEKALLAGKHGQNHIYDLRATLRDSCWNSCRRKALYRNLERSGRPHSSLEEAAEASHSLSEPTLRFRLPHITTIYLSRSLRSNHRILQPL